MNVPSVDVSVTEQPYSVLHVEEQELVDALAIHAVEQLLALVVVHSPSSGL